MTKEFSDPLNAGKLFCYLWLDYNFAIKEKSLEILSNFASLIYQKYSHHCPKDGRVWSRKSPSSLKGSSMSPSSTGMAQPVGRPRIHQFAEETWTRIQRVGIAHSGPTDDGHNLCKNVAFLDFFLP